MNKEIYNGLFENQQAEIIEWCYTVSQGKIENRSYQKIIKFVDDEHFTTSGYGYNIKFDEIQKWRMNSIK